MKRTTSYHRCKEGDDYAARVFLVFGPARGESMRGPGPFPGNAGVAQDVIRAVMRPTFFPLARTLDRYFSADGQADFKKG